MGWTRVVKDLVKEETLDPHLRGLQLNGKIQISNVLLFPVFFFFFFKYPSRKLMGKRRTKVRSSLWSKEIPTLFVNFQTAQGGVSHHSVVHRNKSYVHPGFLIGLMGPMRCYRSRELCEPNTQEPPSWVKWVWTVSFTPSQHHCEHGACRVM